MFAAYDLTMPFSFTEHFVDSKLGSYTYETCKGCSSVFAYGDVCLFLRVDGSGRAEFDGEPTDCWL